MTTNVSQKLQTFFNFCQRPVNSVFQPKATANEELGRHGSVDRVYVGVEQWGNSANFSKNRGGSLSILPGTDSYGAWE